MRRCSRPLHYFVIPAKHSIHRLVLLLHQIQLEELNLAFIDLTDTTVL